MTLSIEQHNKEIHNNLERWRKKPLLRQIYSDVYREIADRVILTVPGKIVEIGSGMGNIKKELPSCITTDVFANPWLDAVENAYTLTFATGSVANLILFDVWHHLQFPGTALQEFRRVLRPGGRLIIFDPAMGLFGRIVFGLFHHEPLGLRKQIEWNAPPTFMPEAHQYYAAQGNASRIFGDSAFLERFHDWRIREISRFSALAYLGSGGFRGPQLYPGVLLPFVRALDRKLSKVPWLASRLLVVLERKA